MFSIHLLIYQGIKQIVNLENNFPHRPQPDKLKLIYRSIRLDL